LRGLQLRRARRLERFFGSRNLLEAPRELVPASLVRQVVARLGLVHAARPGPRGGFPLYRVDAAVIGQQETELVRHPEQAELQVRALQRGHGHGGVQERNVAQDTGRVDVELLANELGDCHGIRRHFGHQRRRMVPVQRLPVLVPEALHRPVVRLLQSVLGALTVPAGNTPPGDLGNRQPLRLLVQAPELLEGGLVESQEVPARKDYVRPDGRRGDQVHADVLVNQHVADLVGCLGGDGFQRNHSL